MSLKTEIYEDWLQAKQDERAAVEKRREMEKLLTDMYEVTDDFEGSKTVDDGKYKIKVTGRMNRKIDSEKLQEVAVENGLFDHLSTLFRWKPEINKKAWEQAAPEITAPLSEAITTKPGKPSFSISIMEDK